MRKVAFVVFNHHNEIIDRFMLDHITDISGIGMRLRLSTIDGDIESIVTKVVQEKQDIKFKIHFVNRAYEKSEILTQWIEKYSTYDMRLGLEYTDGVITRYTEGKVTDFTKTEKDQYGQLVRECTFKPLSPFFSQIANTIKIKVAASGKSYPFVYPYSYGANVVTNNEINNTYILDVPITVKLTGTISNPSIRLFDEDDNEYCKVQFTGKDLTDGQYILINSDTRKIYFFDGSEEVDWTAEADPDADTFLRAKRGKSTLSVNLSISDTGELTGSWRQYGL